MSGPVEPGSSALRFGAGDRARTPHIRGGHHVQSESRRVPHLQAGRGRRPARGARLIAVRRPSRPPVFPRRLSDGDTTRKAW